MVGSGGKLAILPRAERERLEALLLEFDQAWEPGRLAQQVAELSSDGDQFRQAALEELVKIDLERQWQVGNPLRVEDYLAQFPGLGTHRTVAVELLHAEYEARRERGAGADLSDFQGRFPQLAGQLQEAVRRHGPSHVGIEAKVDTRQGPETGETTSEAPPARSSSLPEQFGRYRIIKRLGEGAMGSVYLAQDTDLHRNVALKVPKFEGAEDRQLVERFYREARAAAKLQHRNICPVYDVGEIEGTRYISMAYVQGRTLSAYIRPDRVQGERAAAMVVRKLAQALQEAHTQGIVHRDLKPANIMIDGKKEPVIMDFGLARQLSGQGDSQGTLTGLVLDSPPHLPPQQNLQLTQTGAILGTPAYMSPEQVHGEIDRLGPASDVYSLGVILFELLTGRVPFEGPVAAVLGQIMTCEEPKPSESRPDLDPRLESICLKMMSKRIEDRYASMEEVADALTRFLQAPAEEALEHADPPAQAEDEREQLRAMFATQHVEPPPRPTALPRITVGPPPLRRARRPVPPKAWVAATAAGLLAALLLGVVTILLRTPYGTVKIELDDPDLTVTIDGKEYRSGQLTEPCRLEANRHRLTITLGDVSIPIGETVELRGKDYEGRYRLSVRLDGEELDGDWLTISSGDRRVLSISLEPRPTRAVAKGADVPEGATGAAGRGERSLIASQADPGSAAAANTPSVEPPEVGAEGAKVDEGSERDAVEPPAPPTPLAASEAMPGVSRPSTGAGPDEGTATTSPEATPTAKPPAPEPPPPPPSPEQPAGAAEPMSDGGVPDKVREVLDRVREQLAQRGGAAIAGRLQLSDGASVGPMVVHGNFATRGEGCTALMIFDEGWYAMWPWDRAVTQSARLQLCAFEYDPIDLPVRMKEGEITFVDVIMQKTAPDRLGDIVGKVVDRDSRPFPEADLNVRSGLSASMGMGRTPSRSVPVGQDGTFRISGLAPSTYTVVATGFGHRYHSEYVRVAAGQTVTQNFILLPYRTIVVEYVLQTDGTRRFTGDTVRRGTFDWTEGSNAEEGPGIDSGIHLWLSTAGTDMQFSGSGLQDAPRLHFAGAVDFETLLEAPEGPYVARYAPCRQDCVYVTQTSQSKNYVKFVVRKINE